MGWFSGVLRWLTFGRIGASASTTPVAQVFVVGTDRSQVTVVGRA